MNIFVLSPHRGDAAFSLSLALFRWLGASHSVTLLNCFTRSLYAPYSDADYAHPNDRLSYVSAMRRREDELFLSRLKRSTKKNLRMMDLNLKDAPLRLRCSDENVCEVTLNPEDPAIAKIRKVLARLIAELQVDALLIPLGLGRDVDHLVVRESALPFSSKLPCAFYEDLPYAERDNVAISPETRSSMSETQTIEPLVPTLCRLHGGRDIKRTLALGYASQIDRSTADVIADFSLRYAEGERLWANAAWLSIAERSRLSDPVPEDPEDPED